MGRRTDVSLPERQARTSASERTVRVTELGLRGHVEGLLVTPLAEEAEIDLDRLRISYHVEGDWFPFDIRLEGHIAVLDDDGSLFLPTKGFSEQMTSHAREELIKLASLVYE